jgi:uncharacterized cupin superfamily protein
MPKIDLDMVPVKAGSIYPAPYDAEMKGRSFLRLGDATGLSQFGANLILLEPNAKSSLRHWHLNEDEFVMVTKGTVTLIDDHGSHEMTVGDCAGFPAGDTNGHHFINQTNTEARFLVIGTRATQEVCTYSDMDMKVDLHASGYKFTRKDGTDL